MWVDARAASFGLHPIYRGHRLQPLVGLVQVEGLPEPKLSPSLGLSRRCA